MAYFLLTGLGPLRLMSDDKLHDLRRQLDSTLTNVTLELQTRGGSATVVMDVLSPSEEARVAEMQRRWPHLKMSPLEDASAQELWDELAKRHPSAVILLERVCEKDDDVTEFVLWWRGSISTALGLVTRAGDRFKRICAEAESDSFADDDSDEPWKGE